MHVRRVCARKLKRALILLINDEVIGGADLVHCMNESGNLSGAQYPNAMLLEEKMLRRNLALVSLVKIIADR